MGGWCDHHSTKSWDDLSAENANLRVTPTTSSKCDNFAKLHGSNSLESSTSWIFPRRLATKQQTNKHPLVHVSPRKSTVWQGWEQHIYQRNYQTSQSWENQSKQPPWMNYWTKMVDNGFTNNNKISPLDFFVVLSGYMIHIVNIHLWHLNFLKCFRNLARSSSTPLPLHKTNRKNIFHPWKRKNTSSSVKQQPFTRGYVSHVELSFTAEYYSPCEKISRSSFHEGVRL